MAKMFTHILYTFNFIYLYFLGEVTAHCAFDALAVYANRGCIFYSVNSIDVPVLEKCPLNLSGWGDHKGWFAETVTAVQLFKPFSSCSVKMVHLCWAPQLHYLATIVSPSAPDCFSVTLGPAALSVCCLKFCPSVKSWAFGWDWHLRSFG